MKYEAYHQVYSYTGYELDKLEEKNGTYYTESGEDILDLVNHAVEDTGKVPKEYKQQMKNWIHDLVSTMSVKGWNNVSDMTLSILYGTVMFHLPPIHSASSSCVIGGTVGRFHHMRY